MQPLTLPVLPSIIGFVVLVVISGFALGQGFRKPVNFLFAAVTFLAALINADVALISLVESRTLAQAIDRVAHMFFIFIPPVYIHFVHYYLKIEERRWLEYLSYLLVLFILVLVPTPSFIAGLNYYDFGTVAKAGPLYHLFSLLVIVTLTYCLICLYRRMGLTESNLEKNRLKYLLVGMGGTGLFLSLNILPISGYHVYPMSNFSFVPALLLAYGFLKYDLFDLGLVLREGASYFLLTAIMTVIYVAIIAGFNFVFWGYSLPHGVALSFILAMLMVWLFNPLRNRLQTAIDGIFYKGKYDYKKLLKEISGQMASLQEAAQIRNLFLRLVFDALKVFHIEVLLAENDGSFTRYRYDDQGEKPAVSADLRDDDPSAPLLAGFKGALTKQQVNLFFPQERDREALAGLFLRLDSYLLVPLASRLKLAGVISLGQKKSGELFVKEDLEMLSTLASSLLISLDNARSYLALESLNRELERKVEERTGQLRQALEEKERTQGRLIKSESLAAIGQLVAGVAHELNNPLSSAKSLLQTSVDEIETWRVGREKKAEIIDDLNFSLKDLTRAADIVKSLLSVSRMQETYVEKVNMNKVIEDALRILYNKYKYLPLEIEKNYAGDLPEISGNFAGLSQIMINIIKNAIQSLPEGRGRIVLVTSRKGNNVLVEVADSGRGMTSKEMRNIFKPFFTTKEVGEGVGLGLYISHGIAERHGGHIYAASEEGRGSSFKVELPIDGSYRETAAGALFD